MHELHKKVWAERSKSQAFDPRFYRNEMALAVALERIKELENILNRDASDAMTDAADNYTQCAFCDYKTVYKIMRDQLLKESQG